MKEENNINIDQLYNQIDHLLETADKYEETNPDIEQGLRNSVITIRMLMKELGISPYRKYWKLMSDSSLLSDTFVCPECNHTAEDQDILPKFCSECGERLFKRSSDIRYISRDRNVNTTDIMLDEAIKHAEEVAEEQEELYKICPASESEIYCDGTKDCMALKNGKNKGCWKCAKEHHQLAEWLKELKQSREQASYISLNKKLPNIQNYSEGYFVTFKHGSVHISKFTECDGKDLCTSDDIYDEIVAYLLGGHMM